MSATEIHQHLSCGVVIEGGTKDVYDKHIYTGCNGEPCTPCLLTLFKHSSEKDMQLKPIIRRRDFKLRLLAAEQERVANTIKTTTNTMELALTNMKSPNKRKREDDVKTCLLYTSPSPRDS